MKQSWKTRLLALILSVLMVVSMLSSTVFATEAGAESDQTAASEPVAPVSAAAQAGTGDLSYPEITYDDAHNTYYNVISKVDYYLAPGITESEIVLNNDSGSQRQVTHVVEVDVNNAYTKVMPSYKGMLESLESEDYAVQIMSQQAAYAEANGYGNIVAAMNLSLSWYDSQYYIDNPGLVGEPLGYLVMDGKYFENSNGPTSGAQTCAVINFDEKDGVARPADIPKTEIRSTSSPITGWEEQVIPANFGFLVKNGVNQYSADNNANNGASRSFVGIKEDGTFVMVMNDGRQAPYSTGFTNYEMAEFMLALGCVQAVNGDGGGSSAFLSQRPGEDLKLNCSPSDGAERPTTHGILVISSAPADGQFARASITTDAKYYTPGSTVTFKALGTDLVGNEAVIPADVTWQMADPAMGTIENGVFVSNGTVGTATAQMVYKDQVVGSCSVEIVIPETISFAQSVMTIPYDKEVELTLIATVNEGLNNVVLKPSDITFTFTNEGLGTLNGFKFTSVSQENAPESIQTTVTATLNHDESLVATATMSLGKGSEVLFDFESAEDVAIWHYSDVNGNDAGFVHELSYATAANGHVHDGVGSMRLYSNAIAAPNVGAGGYAQLDLYMDEPVIVENAKSIGFWAYIPDEYEHCWIRVLYWYDSNNDGVFDKKNTISVINQPEVYNNWDESGWKYFSVDVSSYQKVLIPGLSDKTNFGYNNGKNDANNFRFIEFMFPHTNTNDLWKTYGTLNGPYTIYVDNVTVDYSDAVDDREPPKFSSVSVSKNDELVAIEKYTPAVVTNNSLNVVAAVAEDTAKTNATGLNASSAKAYVDGVEVPCAFSNGRLSIADIAVADGMHRVKFEIADNMGNKSVVIRLIKVQSGVEASTIQAVPQNAALDRLYGGSLYWMDLKATDIETIQSVTTVIDLNSVNHWELDHMVLAEGFTATYTVDKETNSAAITITRTGVNQQTGEAVLASLPIRIIYFDTDIKMEGHTADTYWDTFDFWPQDLKVDVDMGKITYVAGYESGVLGAFSNEEFSVDTEMYVPSGSMDPAFKAERGTCHVHAPEAVADKAATCSENGYTGRTYCAVCSSVVDWGTEIPAEGHSYVEIDGKMTCENACGEVLNGVLDGKYYIDGVLANGWVDDTYYYVDGIALTGSHFMDGKMYTFNESGVYQPNYMYDGFYEIDDTVMYFIGNEYVTGYQRLESKYYFFDENGRGFDGELEINGTKCLFEDGQSIATEEVDFAGLCGENAYFVIYASGDMVICGSGAMYDYTTIGLVPWVDMRYDIKTLTIGKDITYIGERSFRSLLKVTELTFEEGSQLKEIARIAFSYCDSLESVILPDGLEVIKGSAFLNCVNLKYVYLPASITAITNDCMVDCHDDLTVSVVANSAAHRFAEHNKIKYTLRVEAIAEGTCGDAAWNLTSDGVLTISGSGAMADNESGKAPWQSHADKITKIVIGKDITYIGKFNFAGLKKVTEVVFEEGCILETIGWGAFGSCAALTEITIPASVKTINNYAFYYCTALKDVKFADDSELITIGTNAFLYDAAIENVFVPDKVTSIGANAFRDCLSTATFNVAEGTYAHDYFAKYNVVVREPVLYTIDSGACGETAWTLTSDGVLTISGSGAMADNNNGEAPWQAHARLIRKIVIGKDVTYIGKFNFYGLNKVTEVVFEEGCILETIGWGSFGFCSALTEITIPASVKTINNYAFYYCTGLKDVKFADDSELITIGTNAFLYDAAIENVFVPDKVTSIGANAFRDCLSTATFNVAEGTYAHDYFAKYNVVVREPVLYTIDSGACGETAWTLTSDGVLTISGSGAMADNNNGEAPWQVHARLIRKIVIGKDVTYIGKFNFYGLNKVTEVVFEEGCILETIGWGSFGFCSALTEITIPASVKTINNYAFYYCTGLKDVKFADNSELTTMGANAFLHDAAIENVFVPDKVTTIGANAFRDCLNTATFNVARGTYGHDYFAKYNVVVRDPVLYTIDSGVCGETAWTLTSDGTLTISGSGAMADNNNGEAPWQAHARLIRKIVIGKDVTYIGKFNFYNMNKVTEVVFEEGCILETIGWGSFGFCSALTEITIPASVKTISNYAFYYCTALVTVDFAPNSALQTIGNCAFRSDTSLVAVNYPTGASVSSNAFYGCTKMN